jgi:DNA-binding transcriptional ArsR family regulator
VTYETSITALADPTRRAILDQLRSGPMTVGDIAADLPVSRAAVSRHLAILKEAGFVSDTPEGTKRIYRIEHRGVGELRTWIERLWKQVAPRKKVNGRSKKKRR